jgi:hypothetical protein
MLRHTKPIWEIDTQSDAAGEANRARECLWTALGLIRKLSQKVFLILRNHLW